MYPDKIGIKEILSGAPLHKVRDMLFTYDMLEELDLENDIEEVHGTYVATVLGKDFAIITDEYDPTRFEVLVALKDGAYKIVTAEGVDFLKDGFLENYRLKMIEEFRISTNNK